FGRSKFGLSFLDISTGEFLTSEGSRSQVDKLLQNFAPNELLISKAHKKDFEESFGKAHHAFYLEDWIYQVDYAHERLNGHFGTKNLKGFGIDHLQQGVIASGAVLHYLGETRHHRLGHINNISRITKEQYVWMDRFTVRNLEIYPPPHRHAVTLLDIIDHTRSPMGGRMLKRWLALPLKQLEVIQDRHQVVAQLKEDPALLAKFQQQIKPMGDLERLVSKLATGKITPREVIHLKNSLEALVPIKAAAEQNPNASLKKLGSDLDPCHELRDKIKEVLTEEAPVNIGKGNTIATGYCEELDELRGLAFSGKDYLKKMLERETQRTGISSLKIASNNVFGYYIEVRNTHRDKVPDDWIRKQTLVNAERYITEELKEYESKILGAEERILDLEQQLFERLLVWMQQYISPVQQNAQGIARLDCLCGFAQLAVENN